MSDVPAHEQDETFVEHDLIAEHAERSESELFRHNKALLIAQFGRQCWMKADLCDGQIEAHHIAEFCEAPNVDFVRLKAFLLHFDPYGYSLRLAALPITSIDDLRNLILLDDRCHRGVGLGIHHLTFPTWVARKVRRDGESITSEERALRAASHDPSAAAAGTPGPDGGA